MAPDINSLPPSRSSSLSNNRAPPPRTSSNQLNQPATSPALQALQQSPQLSPRSSRAAPRMERRRSSMLNDSLTSSATHSPTASIGPPSHADHNLPNPQQHHRAPSLGELHQELESEHEAQVNRLLAQIRLEQHAISERERHTPPVAAPGTTSSTHPAAPSSTGSTAATAVGDPSAPLPPRSRTSSAASSSRAQLVSPSLAYMPSAQHPSAPRGTGSSASHSLSRQSSMRSDRSTSRSRSRQLVASPQWGVDGDGWGGLGLRDEASFVQAETANVARENQMLKGRIRELERMLAERDRAGGERLGSGSSTG